MNTTIIDGVEIKQGDEVEVSEWKPEESTRCYRRKFIADLGIVPGKGNRYVVTGEDGTPWEVFPYMRPIPKKQRVPLDMNDIITKYFNGALRIKSHSNVYKITDITERGVLFNDGHEVHEYTELADDTFPDDTFLITPDGINWFPCSKEI